MVGIYDRDGPLDSVIMVILYYLSNYELRKKDLFMPWNKSDETFL